LESQGNAAQDSGERQELRAAHDRIGAAWQDGVYEVLQQRNPELLAELDECENVLDSLMVIKNKPSLIRKQWQHALANYEKTAMLCIKYAKRHMPVPQKS
jgi:hypothetical protein